MMRASVLIILISLCASFVQASPRSNDVIRTLDTRYKWYGIYLGMDKTQLDREITSFKSDSTPRFALRNETFVDAAYMTQTGVSSLSYAGIRTIFFYWSENHKLLGYNVDFEPTQYQQWLTDLPMFFDGFDQNAKTNVVGIENRLSNASIKITTSRLYSGMLVTR